MAEGCGFHSLQNLRRFANMRLLKLDLILGKERQHTFPRPRPPRWASGTFLTILDFSSHPGTAFPGIFWQFFTFSKQPWALPRLTSPGHNELASPEIFWQFPSQGGKVVHPPPNQDKPRPHPLPFLLPPLRRLLNNQSNLHFLCCPLFFLEWGPVQLGRKPYYH